MWALPKLEACSEVETPTWDSSADSILLLPQIFPTTIDISFSFLLFVCLKAKGGGGRLPHLRSRQTGFSLDLLCENLKNSLIIFVYRKSYGQFLSVTVCI